MSSSDDLFRAALAARANAHAPYSGYAVGAAVRDADGRVFAGCNVENASYPEGCCAETAAVAAMVAAGGTRIVEICIIGSGDGLTTPCGGCRQRLREFADEAAPVHICGPEGPRRTFTLGELLPWSFGPSNLQPGGGS